MTGELIKSFLVGLGFEIDDAGLNKFNKSITAASVKVAALGTAITATATAIGLGISKISQDFEQLGYEYRIIAPAINKALLLRRAMLSAFKAANINITEVVRNSVRLNFSLAKTKFAFEAIYKSVASRFFPLITKQSDIFRAKLYANMPRIQAALERFINFVFKAFEAVTQLGSTLWSILTRVWDFFVALDKATGGWSTKILGAVAAWELLNLSFLATPLGMIITGLVALLALYDDFKTFQEGGKSLFNWGPVVPFLNLVGRSVMDVVHAFEILWGWVEKVGSAMWKFGAAGIMAIKGVFGDNPGNVAANAGNNPASQPLVNPIGSTSNSQTNQNVNQQTSITVQGSADANSVGKSVASEQSRVNFDMVRNMRGATR